jgi:hypothetical protein
MLMSDEPDDEAICQEGLYVVLSTVAMTTGNYDCTTVHPNYVWPGNGHEHRSRVRSNYDHRKLRLHGSPPELRLIGLNTNFTKILPGMTAATGNYDCMAVHPNYAKSK